MLQTVRSLSLRPREDRRRVMLPARMRSASGWSDACILNISSRGLLVYSNGSAAPGSFVEVRRGGQLVLATVVWRKNRRIGLHSPDPVRMEDIISTETAASAARSTTTRAWIDRRRLPRDPDRSRARGRAMEYMATLLIGTSVIGVAAIYAQQILSGPLLTIRTVLGAH